MFSNDVFVRWVGERKMELIWPLIFTDKNGKAWTAKVGDCVDGASIPKFFWRFIGSPFVGRYRRPSVIHDVYCDSKSEPCDKVHALFYEMMLAEGVPGFKAKIMYYAVRFGGPRW